MNHNPRQVTQWELIRGFVFGLFITPVVMFIVALLIKYGDRIDEILN